MANYYSQNENYPSAETSRTVGICTGTLAAAVLSCSRNMHDLVSLAIDAVTVAFRTGLVVIEAANRVSAVQESDQSWSMILPDTAAVDIVRDFCEQSVGYPYILCKDRFN